MDDGYSIPVVHIEPIFLKEDDAARLFSLSATTFRQLAKKHGIKPTRLSERRLAYHREALHRLGDMLFRRTERVDRAHE